MAFRPGVRAHLDQHAAEIVAAYQDGASLDDLASTYECSHTPLRALLKSQGVTLRPNRRRVLLEAHEERVREMYATGHSTSEIAAALQVDRNTASQFVQRLGIRRQVGLRKRTFYIETDIDKGIMAGLLLGEGSIVATRSGIVVRIVNQDRDIIDWLAQFGGCVHWVIRDNPRTPNPLGTWDLARAVDVLHFLTAIGPLLVGVKRVRAERALITLRDRFGLSHEEAL